MLPTRKIWLLFTFLFGLYIIYGTLFPFYAGALPWESLATRKFWILSNQPHSPLGDIIANLLFFLPFSFSLIQYLGKSWKAALGVVLTCFLLSYLVETMQQLSPVRRSSLIDVWVNTGSGLCGVFLYKVQQKWFPSFPGRTPGGKWALPAVLAILVLVLDATQPFDFSIDPLMFQAEVSLLKKMQLVAHPGYIGIWWRSCMLVIMSTAIFCAWMVELKVRNYGRKGILAIVAGGVLLESLQLMVASRVPSLIDFTAYPMGGLAGLALYRVMPKKAVLSSILFWGAAGAALGLSLGPKWFSNGDVFYLENLPYALYSYHQVFLISETFRYILFFFTPGFLVPYWIMRGKKLPTAMWAGALSFLTGFALLAVWRQGFLTFLVSIQGGAGVVGILLGFVMAYLALIYRK